MFKTNATAIICGETYEVKVVTGPDVSGFYTVDVMFADGDWTERMGIMKENVWLNENEIPEYTIN